MTRVRPCLPAIRNCSTATRNLLHILLPQRAAFGAMLLLFLHSCGCVPSSLSIQKKGSSKFSKVIVCME